MIKICSNGKYRDTETNKFVSSYVIASEVPEKGGIFTVYKGKEIFGVRKSYKNSFYRLLGLSDGYEVLHPTDGIVGRAIPVYASSTESNQVYHDGELHGFVLE
jgi:hypothetical protein